MTFTGAWKTQCRPLYGTCSCQVPPLGSPGHRRAPRRLPSAGLNDDGLHKHKADLDASGRREEGKPPGEPSLPGIHMPSCALGTVLTVFLSPAHGQQQTRHQWSFPLTYSP